MLPAYPISILISNVVVAHYGKNIGVSFLENEIRHFHGIGYMDIIENQILHGDDIDTYMEVAIVVLVLNYTCENNRAIYGIILSNEEDIEWFKERKKEVETGKVGSSYPTYKRTASESNLYFRGDTSSSQNELYYLLTEKKLRTPRGFGKSLLDIFLPNRQKELP